MRDLLNIGELAKMLKISTSKIRYYEKKGLLKPEKIDDNGYRLYGYKQLDKLDSILLLRRLGVSLKQLQSLFRGYSIDDYLSVLEESKKGLIDEISKLTTKKRALEKKIYYANSFKEDKLSFKLVNKKERVFSCLKIGSIFKYSIKTSYDTRDYCKIPLFDEFEEAYTIYHGKNIYSVFKEYTDNEIEEHLPKLILPKGQYACYGVLVKDGDKVSTEVEKFKNYIKDLGLSIKGEIVISDNYRHFYYYEDRFYINIEALVTQ